MEQKTRLSFVKDAGRIKYKRSTVLLIECICTCGNTIIVRKPKFVNGVTKSCGCLQKEHASQFNKSHGMTNTPEYRSWYAMLTRCNNKNSAQYKDYGGRGIVVCEEWVNSFENFFKDMGYKPSRNHSIERTDNNKGYNKNNCVWATRIEQCSNKSNNRKFLYKGQELTVTEISRRSGIGRSKISNWANRSGYSKEKIEQIINSH